MTSSNAGRSPPETLESFLNQGTMNRAGVWSPCNGRPGVIALTMEDLRRQGQQGLLDTQMTVVVVDKKRRRRRPRFATTGFRQTPRLRAAEVEVEDLRRPVQGDSARPAYGANAAGGSAGNACSRSTASRRWADMFTPRQLSPSARSPHRRDALGNCCATQSLSWRKRGAYLALCCSTASLTEAASFANGQLTGTRSGTPLRDSRCRCAGISRMCHNNRGIWRLPGAAGTGGPVLGHRRGIRASAAQADIVRQSAITPRDGESALDAVVTDPPYYDAIPYSDLMDFFYIWLRQSALRESVAEIDTVSSRPRFHRSGTTSEADGELIDDRVSFRRRQEREQTQLRATAWPKRSNGAASA